MCETKKKIGDTLHELIMSRPLERITVNDIMERSGMKMQSFYYHFADVYEVLDWELDRRLYKRIAYDPEAKFDDWVVSVAEIISSDRRFYYRVIEAEGRDRVMKTALPVVKPYIIREITGKDVLHETIMENERVVAQFMSEALINYAIDRVVYRKILTDSEIRSQTEMIIRFASRNISLNGIRTRQEKADQNKKEAKLTAVCF